MMCGQKQYARKKQTPKSDLIQPMAMNLPRTGRRLRFGVCRQYIYIYIYGSLYFDKVEKI